MFLNLNLFHVVDKKKTRDLRSVVFKCYMYVRLKNKELVRKKRKWANYLVNLLPWRLQRELIAFIGTAPQCYRFPIEFGDPSYQPPLYNPPRIIASRCALFLYETYLIYVLTTDVEVQICIKDEDRGWGLKKFGLIFEWSLTRNIMVVDLYIDKCNTRKETQLTVY